MSWAIVACCLAARLSIDYGKGDGAPRLKAELALDSKGSVSGCNAIGLYHRIPKFIQ
jgi:hypothetical protein